MKKEYYIKLNDGQVVPVTEEVYREYKRPQWRETKQKKVRQMREFSLEYMTENGMEHIYSDNQKLVEDIAEDNLMLEMLMKALETLTDAPSRQKWTQKSFKKRHESQYFVNLLKPTAFIPRLPA